MLLVLSPLLLLAGAGTAALAVKLWSADSRASRTYSVACGAVGGCIAGLFGTELWCWLDRVCRTRQGDGMAGGMTLLVFALFAATAGAAVGLAVGVGLCRWVKARRALFAATPALLVASSVVSIVLAAWAAL